MGDATHGKGPLNRWWAERLGGQRLWLHAWAMEVAHPVTGLPLHVSSGLPAPFSPALTGPADSALPAQDWLRLLREWSWMAG